MDTSEQILLKYLDRLEIVTKDKYMFGNQIISRIREDIKTKKLRLRNRLTSEQYREKFIKPVVENNASNNPPSNL